ncbi:hypothetical protein [Streptomyces cyaneofuscatus]|uniref:Uncharacterized protein n=1 Tax=Streptomyces cyaneofuscatus TaxID=66883 RepID=A0ABZ1EUN3_9ACTN|nr:hypothetical protein [Streptomyces cyaneofuscatus]WSB07792.1 hypothetical protein OG849_11255 [Streptomyces cyaneofuscatus]WSD48675.1 hypothetical protein OG857_24145 [Streptomyces cyaneofuscatus]
MTPPAGSLPIPEGALKLPEGTTALPEGTVRGTDKDGNIVHLDREGNILKEDGTLKQHHSAAPDGNPADGAPVRTDADTPLPRTPAEESALVGAGARTGGSDSIRLGSDFGDTGRLGDYAGRTGDDLSRGGPAGHVSNGGLRDSLTPGGHADGLSHDSSASHQSLSGNHSDGPGGGGGSHDGPAGSDGTADDGGHVSGGSGNDFPPRRVRRPRGRGTCRRTSGRLGRRLVVRRERPTPRQGSECRCGRFHAPVRSG